MPLNLINNQKNKWQNLFFKITTFCLAIIFVFSILNSSVATLALNNNNLQLDLEEFPDGEQWIDYFTNNLMPFYTDEEVFGEPIGNFPTWRCNDGSVYVPETPCEELLKSYKNRESILSKSRQTYFYGVAYHLTGDEKMLSLAKAGVDYIRNNAIDNTTGSIATYVEDGVNLPPVLQRTTQQLAYNVLGLAFYYYLTRDRDVLEDITRLKNHIFENYYNTDWDLFMWSVETEPTENDNPNQRNQTQWKRLPAQLDHINAYLLLLTPILPAQLQKEWEDDLIHLSDILINQFYSPQNNWFKFTLDQLTEEEKNITYFKPNFGTTIKSFWMLYLIAKLTNNQEVISWVEDSAPQVLEQAYIQDSGSWGYRIKEDGEIDGKKQWWVYNELDQMTATLALKDHGYLKYLINTYNYWFKYFVDHKNYEVWTWLQPNGEVNENHPKVPPYKKGYHTAEHALIAYITAQAIHEKPVDLYYALKTKDINSQLFPYYFLGEIENKALKDFENFGEYKKVKVTFNKIR